MNIRTLLTTNECEWLDFKQEHHDDTLKLLHDILCLANARVESDRFLVFGITNDRTVVGVESDGNRRRSADIQDLLRSSRLNRIPIVTLATSTLEGHEVDVLTIRNLPDKPFFVTRDKESRGNVLRAGVMYTRIGDTNVPLRESATEADIELAWRERFGLTLSPLLRAFRLLKKPEDWERTGEDEYLYHREFPEFTVVDGATLDQNFQEEWTKRFPDKSARSFDIEIRYNSTVLRRITFVSCDGGRYKLPLPSLRTNGTFEVNTNSLAWRVMQLYRQYLPADSTLIRVGVKLVNASPESDYQ